jgi:hypothetical protein
MLVATNSPWVWKIGSACSRTSEEGEAPVLRQRPRVRQQVVLRQHRALRPAGRAGGIEESRKVTAIAVDGGKLRRHPLRRRGQAAGPVGVERFGLGRQAVGDRGERRARGLVADHHARAAVLYEIGQLIDRVGGVERQEDDARLRTGGIEREGFRRFVDLCRQPVAGRKAGPGQGMGEARRIGEERGVGPFRTVGELQEGVGPAGMRPEQRVV